MRTVIASTNLSIPELNNRMDEVFDMKEGDYVRGIVVYDNGLVSIDMEELEESTRRVVPLDYRPDMSERPQALDYLLGKRNDFND